MSGTKLGVRRHWVIVVLMLYLLACSSGVMETRVAIDDIEIVWSLVQGGTFEMGDPDPRFDSSPAHTVQITQPYWMMQTEVRQDLYTAIMQDNPSATINPAHPVERVSWIRAVTFANALSRTLGMEECYDVSSPETVVWTNGLECDGLRLPTEAEWEWAALGGHLQSKWKGESAYSGGNTLSSVGWYKMNSENQPHPVGQLNPNELYLYDLTGNVSEWVWDGYESYTESLVVDPYTKTPNLNRVNRGGGWPDDIDDQNLKRRATDGYDYAFDWVGFRLVRSQ